MKTPSLKLWWLRLATFLLAALAAASAVYWVLKWTAGAPAVPRLPAAPSIAQTAQSDPQVVARLLGGGQKTVVATLAESAASRFKLMGVIADRNKGGYALISVDGKPARPYRVGSPVNDTLVLQSVAPRSAALAASLDAPPSVALELPKPSSESAQNRAVKAPLQPQQLPAPQAVPQAQVQPEIPTPPQVQPQIQAPPQVLPQPHTRGRTGGQGTDDS